MKTMYAARRLTAAALAVLCVLLLAAGCARKHPSAAAPIPQKDGDLNDMMTISTRYGDLYFSDQWEDSLRVEQSSSGSTELVSFIAVLDEGEYPLFQLEIADSTNEPGAVGMLTDRQGVRRDVFVSMEPLPEGQQIDQLYAMRDGLNDLIENLK